MAADFCSARLLAAVACLAVQVAAQACKERGGVLATSLLSTNMRQYRAPGPAAGETCAVLSNAGSHFTVDVEVGTPSQTFSVVADTGSNSLIVPSCICQQSGGCRGSGDRCFTGTNRSSTFQLFPSEDSGQPQEMLLTFGSGQIQGIVAKDKVTVGRATTFMKEGFLLMVDRALDFKGPFEGILGLGLPPDASTLDEDAAAAAAAGGEAGAEGGESSASSAKRWVKSIIEKIMGVGSAGGGDTAENLDKPMPIRMTHSQGGQVSRRGLQAASVLAPSFLAQAGVSRFSICLGEEKGSLRLDTPPALNALGSVGKEHWGLDFRGISVGDASLSARLDFCRAEQMGEEQETPCGVIPDSGTTLLMGPQEQISKLLEAACDAWPRCMANHTALKKAAKAAKAAATEVYGMNPWKLNAASKEEVFQYVLADCHSWLGASDQGIGELPPLHFHVAGPPSSSGRSGRTMTLELRGEDYVMESLAASSSADETSAPGLSPNPICMPAFGPMEYPTKANGPVWIMGLPLFYAYTVAYDTKATLPSVAFTSVQEAPCGGCGPGVELLASEVMPSGSQQRRKLPRRVQGPPRVPAIDVSQPL